ncbi:MAG: hypothetical protein AVDCRST_MAG93-9193, partial [uncultured Chloroflexia bacterium]
CRGSRSAPQSRPPRHRRRLLGRYAEPSWRTSWRCDVACCSCSRTIQSTAGRWLSEAAKVASVCLPARRPGSGPSVSRYGHLRR